MSRSNLKTNRQLQAYGAVCLAVFCRHLNVSNTAFNVLIDHLFSVLSAENLPAWEQAGASLEVVGRGDPLPEAVVARIEPAIADKVAEAVEWAVETGLIDMYGSTPGRSGECLDRLTDLLTRNRVALPPADLLCFDDEEGWGTPVSKSLQDQIWREYSHLVGEQEPANEAP